LNTRNAPALPPLLDAQWDLARERLGATVDRVSALGPELAAALPGVAACSDFVVAVLERRADTLLERLLDTAPLSAEWLDSELDLSTCASEPEALTRLREIRRRETARIAWQDLSGRAPLEQSLGSLSSLADASVRAAAAFAAGALEPRYGHVVDEAGQAMPLLILGMGKLGGGELNFSSDIDLVLLYPDGGGMTGRGGIEVEEYFRKLAQIVIRLLDLRTQDGFAYRVDTRLRPFGASGPLAVSLPAFEAYLIRHGRDWERYAYIKARLITGCDYERELFDETLTPFVYRRYLDYGVFEALRDMKALISKEVARRDMADNIKLGPGGIREIEFVVQALQLVRGGRDPSLRERSLLRVLPLLAETGQLSAAAAADLERAYRFLRRLENCIQSIGDQQTHELPTDDLDRARVAYAMGTASWDELEGEIAAQRGTVERWFHEMALDGRRDSIAPSSEESWVTAWETGEFADVLGDYCLGDVAEFQATLAALSRSSLYRRMDELSRRRMAAVTTRITILLAEDNESATVLKRVLPILQAVGRRSAYLALLMENPSALERLMTLARHSEFLVKLVAAHPMLLDELLDPRVLEVPPTRLELEQMLEQTMRGAPRDDMELRLDHLRQFQRTAVFRIAIADRFGHLPLMKVSDRLTDTAEIVLGISLEMAHEELVHKHGLPMCGPPDARREAGFIIVAYGKLGGLELGYGSDLDVVFLHDSSGPDQETEGAAPVDNSRFFVRLAQRIIHFLTIQTSSGRLYEVDTRLRPSGASGLLVSSMDTFRKYQREQAWVWEHQALLRSRSVAGPAGLRRLFEEERREILMHHVDRSKLRDEVRSMRERMRAELSGSKTGEFDLKQDPGGLADIEFLVDYWVLDHAAQYPELIEFPDNIRQLEALERVGLVPGEQCRRLIEIYIQIRERLHELALDDRGRVVAASELESQRSWVLAAWNAEFGG